MTSPKRLLSTTKPARLLGVHRQQWFSGHRSTTASAAMLLVACTNGGAPVGSTPTATSTVTTPTSDATDVTRDVPKSVATGSEPLFNGMPPDVQVPADTEPEVTDARLQTCVPSKGPGDDLLIDDFEDRDSVIDEREGRSGVWYQYEEQVGDHQLSFRRLSSPRLESTSALYTSGSDHGQWAGVGVVLSSCVYDASDYVGVHFWIRGESAPVNVALVTPGVIPVSNGGTCTKDAEGLCYDAYRSLVTVTEEWREWFVPFSTFEQLGYGPDAGPLDLTRLESIQFQSSSAAFELWLDDVGFYVEEVYTPYDAGIEPGSTSTAPSSDAPFYDAGPIEAGASEHASDGGNP